ncbi:hypothetical protein DOY81_002175, partial [Sarcophaga bullata]
QHPLNMNFMKYFAIFAALVLLCLLGQHSSEAHSLFGHLEHEVDSEAHKIGDKVDKDAHVVYKDGKEALKIYGDIKTAESIVGVAGGVAHIVESL